MTRSANQSPLASHQSAPAASLSSGSGGNSHYSVGRHCSVGAEAAHVVSQNFPDQPGLIALVGINGGVEPFHFIDFRDLHAKGDSRVCQK